jgi:endonuclease/exonuclease/phosphatase family metal-dependent hydrolase
MLRVLCLIASFLTLPIAFAQPPKIIDLTPKPAVPQAQPGEAKSISFCFWNVENLFDDKDDRRNEIDEEYDDPFARNAKLRQLKLDHLAATILKMNDGRGPDILACAEVESVRAAEILMGTLNKSMKDPADKYKSILMKNLDAGRHISTCVITRLNVSNLATKLHGGNLRILEAHVFVDGQDLCILATHWTSKLRQEGGGQGDDGRSKYARTIYGVYERMALNNPAVDFLVCGDFNDTPDAPQVLEGLRATGDRSRVVKTNRNPQLLDLFANKDPKQFGTIWYANRPQIYDHICVSAGMLDNEGWSCDPDSVSTWTHGLTRPGATRREPWRFGDPNRSDLRDSDRGYSDHFPVLVTLKVAKKK